MNFFGKNFQNNLFYTSNLTSVLIQASVNYGVPQMKIIWQHSFVSKFYNLGKVYVTLSFYLSVFLKFIWFL